MSDTNQIPIVVSASPKQAQIEAGIRQFGIILVSVLGTIGATVWASKLGWIVTFAPQIAQVVTVLSPLVIGAFVWFGQKFTRNQAKALAVAAAAAPDTVARVRG